MTVYGSSLHGYSVDHLSHSKPTPKVRRKPEQCPICGAWLASDHNELICDPCYNAGKRYEVTAEDFPEVPKDCSPTLFQAIVCLYFGSMRAATRELGWTDNLFANYTTGRERLPEWRREALNNLIAGRR